jgi:hypothetical protein
MVTTLTGGLAASTSHARGQSLAQSLLATAILPASVEQQPAPPSAKLSVPIQGAGSGNLIQLTSYWTIPISAGTFTGFAMSHPPARLPINGIGHSGPSLEYWLSFAEVRPLSFASLAGVTYSYARLGGDSTQLRVDAHVIWLPSRTAATLVPLGDQFATLAVKAGVTRHIRLTWSPELRRLIRVVNRLPTVAPPGIINCALSPGTTSLGFTTTETSAPNLSLADVIGCYQFSVTSPSAHVLLS